MFCTFQLVLCIYVGVVQRHRLFLPIYYEETYSRFFFFFDTGNLCVSKKSASNAKENIKRVALTSKWARKERQWSATIYPRCWRWVLAFLSRCEWHNAFDAGDSVLDTPLRRDAERANGRAGERGRDPWRILRPLDVSMTPKQQRQVSRGSQIRRIYALFLSRFSSSSSSSSPSSSSSFWRVSLLQFGSSSHRALIITRSCSRRS